MINDALRRKGEAVGADDQVTKPELDKLIDRMQNCISKLTTA
jgi:two-component system chemotaxis response regulator CheV